MEEGTTNTMSAIAAMPTASTSTSTASTSAATASTSVATWAAATSNTAAATVSTVAASKESQLLVAGDQAEVSKFGGKKRRKSGDVLSAQAERQEILLKAVKDLAEKKPDENASFCEFLSTQLDKMTPRQQAAARMEMLATVNKILYE